MTPFLIPACGEGNKALRVRIGDTPRLAGVGIIKHRAVD
jgi:hypothetical protein